MWWCTSSVSEDQQDVGPWLEGGAPCGALWHGTFGCDCGLDGRGCPKVSVTRILTVRFAFSSVRQKVAVKHVSLVHLVAVTDCNFYWEGLNTYRFKCMIEICYRALC